MRSSSDYVNNNDDNLVSRFDESTCLDNSVCYIFDIEDKIITEDYIVWVNTNKAIWQGRFIKFLSDNFHRIPNILN